MCIIFFAFKQRPEYQLVLLANRDEFTVARPLVRDFGDDAPEIYAGRDLVHGGTWLGITKSGRFAAITNYRHPDADRGTISRRKLVGDFLKADIRIETYLETIKTRAAEFSGFNLLVGDFTAKNQTLGYYSNRENLIKVFALGIYGLSNHLLDTPRRKIVKGKTALAKILGGANLKKNKLFEFLSDRENAADGDLPDTGIGYEREKLLSAIFIETPVYGTRTSSLVLVDNQYEISLDERISR